MKSLANAYGPTLFFESGRWADCEARFKQLLGGMGRQGVEYVAFGNIYLDYHRRRVGRVCAEVGCEAHEQLWGESTPALAEESLTGGYKALVCT